MAGYKLRRALYCPLRFSGIICLRESKQLVREGRIYKIYIHIYIISSIWYRDIIDFWSNRANSSNTGPKALGQTPVSSCTSRVEWPGLNWVRLKAGAHRGRDARVYDPQHHRIKILVNYNSPHLGKQGTRKKKLYWKFINVLHSFKRIRG